MNDLYTILYTTLNLVRLRFDSSQHHNLHRPSGFREAFFVSYPCIAKIVSKIEFLVIVFLYLCPKAG